MAVEKRGRGRPRIPGSQALESPQYELFCLAYIKAGMKRGSRAGAYQHAFSIKDQRHAINKATQLLKRPDVKDRLRFLLREQARNQVMVDAIERDSIEARMWTVVERCLQHEKVGVPDHLKGRVFRSCRPCQKKEPSKWCPSCKSNQKLLAEWQEFGGTYKFDSRGAVNALLPLGRERNLYIDKKLYGNMEGDDIIDSMNDEEVRQLVRSLATEVGLRVVEARGESPDGSSTEQSPKLQAVS